MMHKGVRVLSLFDGMSCGQIALKEIGVPVEAYYASEVDKYAISQTMLNFPQTIQVGDVRELDTRELGHIDLLIGGSPCQNLSVVGKRNGMSTASKEEILSLRQYLQLKKEGFEPEGQSYLFWEYVRVLRELKEENPDVVFLLENVRMPRRWENVIDAALGVRGVHIDSGLVSAQVRRRIYWTNIGTGIPQPQDKGLVIKDIVDESVGDDCILSIDKIRHLCKDPAIRSAEEVLKAWRRDKCAKNGILQLNPSRESHGSQPYQDNRVYDHSGKCPALMSSISRMMIADQDNIRTLTTAEWAKLQTIPSWYLWTVSLAQRRRLMGNGWTVDVITHILRHILRQ